jgi:2-keto-4-pentenoate hydratase/2-oxohepta-3-ene-1,7-dioic acid hydratase in catechol pathway
MNNNQNQAPINNNANNTSSSNNSNQRGAMVPEAKQALNNMKYEIAGELGINLKQGYTGVPPSRQAGYIGGYMVKRLIEQAERGMANQ